MATIKFSRGLDVSDDARNAYPLESDVNLNVYVNYSSGKYNVFSDNGENIMKVGNEIIFYFKNHNISKKNNVAWTFEGLSEGELYLEKQIGSERWLVYFDKKQVATIQKSGNLNNWIAKMWEQKKFLPLERWFKIEFDELNFDSTIAIGCLFMVVSADDFLNDI